MSVEDLVQGHHFIMKLCWLGPVGIAVVVLFRAYFGNISRYHFFALLLAGISASSLGLLSGEIPTVSGALLLNIVLASLMIASTINLNQRTSTEEEE